MRAKACELSWIVVTDLKKATQFYAEKLGFKVVSIDDHYGWAELIGQEGGMRLGLAVEHESNPIKAGQNAVITVVVDDIVKAKEELRAQHVKLHGEIVEIPGHVKLQTFTDDDGNCFQLVEKCG